MRDLYDLACGEALIAKIYRVPEYEVWLELDRQRLSGYQPRPFYGLACRGPFG